jgi:hypothetical protein
MRVEGPLLEAYRNHGVASEPAATRDLARSTLATDDGCHTIAACSADTLPERSLSQTWRDGQNMKSVAVDRTIV